MKSILCEKYHYIISLVSVCICMYILIRTNTFSQSNFGFILLQNIIAFFLFFFLFEHGIGGRYKVITNHRFSHIKLLLGLTVLIVLLFIELGKEVKSICSVIALSLSLAGEYGIIENSKSN